MTSLHFFTTLLIAALASPAADAATTAAEPSSSPAPTSAAASKAEATAHELTAAIGACRCLIDANTRQSGDKPLGEAPLMDFKGRTFPATVVSEEYALKLFQEMTVQHKIPFGFPEDGCFARAHEMAHQLEKQGILVGKVFATGEFRVANDKAENGSVTWGFHVAPVLIVDNGKGRSLWVIDPSLFQQPEPLEKWLTELTAHPRSKLKTAYVTTRFIYHPSKRDRRLKTWDPEDLKAAKRLMKRYVKRERKRTDEKSPDL